MSRQLPSVKRVAESILLFNDMKSRISRVVAVNNVFIMLFLFVAVSGLVQSDGAWVIECVLIICFLMALTWFLNTDTSNIVAGMMLWTVAIFALSKAFYFDGLYDSSLVLYPFVVIFAVFLGGKVLVVPLVLFMVASYYAIAYAVAVNIIENKVISQYSIWAKANDMAAMLVLYGLGIFIISNFIKSLVIKLSEETKYNETVRKDSERRILYDDLTGLPNSEKCKQDISVGVKNLSNKGSIQGFVILHINNFNWINSTLGHDFGDQILIKLAKRLRKLENNKTNVYRTSGTEFTLTTRVPDFEALNEFCHQTIRTTILPLFLAGYDHEMTCSLGVTAAPFDGDSFAELRRKANFAVYRAKLDEPNSYQFYESGMEKDILHRLNMVQDLKSALENREFELYYQPKVDLQSNTIVGAEALIRWHKNGAIIPPNTFIPVAEESGLIVEIGKWVIETACEQCSEWHQLGFKGMTVAVNISSVQFKRGNLPNHVFRALQRFKLDPSMLELEITESLFIGNTDHIQQQIYSMVDKGVNFAIDDFGTGYSNLNYLSNFNASTLKIDMSFVRNMLTNLQQQHIVNAIIQMSRTMNLENVAEGVESAEIAAELKSLGCVYGQGYYWSPPLPAKDFVALLNSQARKA
ncbi:putative bifunctional diguanylate cyclase/phosphodiesterase [Planctobacterium marinum]|uniref:putative bifunctional diguanylate cyclase/phosphodiesterase n=1 Tax=Planctobacterium marinum TaxID=1631968 RepID=UPI001E440C28|nr:GGDEF domain-containing phosphodiesterase [Planctobacterium marinum]MCC2604263.1 EAL domain-containing protein [Planctobacterium marinum]